MSDKLVVGEHETGLYRLFAIDLPEPQIKVFTTPVRTEAGSSDYPLRDALGVKDLDESHVQVLDLKELKTLGFETYLSEGLGIAPEEYASILPTLEALDGYVAVIASAAFEPPEIIIPKAPLSLVTVLREDKPRQAFVDLSTASAEGGIEARQTSPSPTRQRMPAWFKLLIASAALLLLYGVFALVTPGETP